ncbi:MAG: DNA-3-methyladenine glycosylase [Candidatus Nitrosotenuis sp.]
MSHAAIQFLKKDPDLGKIIRSVGPYSIILEKNPYRSLVDAIITQQLSGKAAESISARFKDIYKRYPKPEDVLRTPVSKLQKAGLSRMKISYIKDLSKKVIDEQIQFRILRNMPDDEVVSELTKISGVGTWTAHMFLIFCLGRQDILPVGDLGLRKGIQRLYCLPEIPKDAQIEEIAERWRPYRTVATWYLWKSLKQFDKIG